MPRGKYPNTNEWKAPFLAALRKLPNVLKAAKAAGVQRSWAYAQRETDPEFAAQWDEAFAEGVADIERVAMELAKLRDPKHNSLRMFMLKAHIPEVYGDKSELLLKGSKDQPLQVRHGVDLSGLSMEELDLLERILSGGSGPGEAAGPGVGASGEGTTGQESA